MSRLARWLRGLVAQLRCRHDWQLVGYQLPSSVPGIFVRCRRCGHTALWLWR